MTQFSSIGLLHPGELGAAVGRVLAARHRVLWASTGRSVDSSRRAARAGLLDVGTVEAMKDECDLIVAICPPEAAMDVARQVSGFRGIYLDANAIAPLTAHDVAAVIEQGGGSYVDGSIIGADSITGGTAGARAGAMRFYLSGALAPSVSTLFSGAEVDARVLGDDPTAASGLKMCFAAWTKGTKALLLDIRALAEALGHVDALLAEWDAGLPELRRGSEVAAEQAVTKGWRWQGEMAEIARAFRDAELPDGFHQAASEIYGALAASRGVQSSASALDQVIDSLHLARGVIAG